MRNDRLLYKKSNKRAICLIAILSGLYRYIIVLCGPAIARSILTDRACGVRTFQSVGIRISGELCDSVEQQIDALRGQGRCCEVGEVTGRAQGSDLSLGNRWRKTIGFIANDYAATELRAFFAQKLDPFWDVRECRLI
jgi:hypothetical protein